MDWLKEWVVYIFAWIHETCYNLGGEFLDTVIELLPENEAPTIAAAFGPYYEIVNDWGPAQEAIGLYGSLLALHGAIIVLRWVLKFIPMIG